jgi:hypothetical protein
MTGGNVRYTSFLLFFLQVSGKFYAESGYHSVLDQSTVSQYIEDINVVSVPDFWKLHRNC